MDKNITNKQAEEIYKFIEENFPFSLEQCKADGGTLSSLIIELLIEFKNEM